ncbi:ABC transporter ATP-binding protein [Pseudooceanicola sp. CBS1P-1]|uniref:ATP-binding cassette domain-containing protein n=2 Tax=Paracoccaceae TaxID=31989 RepID=A0A6L7G5T9_9RHOB|nr:ABC transporter ATP-binding protein [Pseudooceanicola endophyticus]MXN19485.1 ATP-binding cassette domain-containing protein [Pseudooceanicola albus]
MSLLGASGSGKTTLLRLIAGFEEPDAGQIALDGTRLDGKPPHQRDIGFVFQNFALFPHLSVAQNVAFGLRYRAANPLTDNEEIRARSEAALELVGLKGFGHRGIGAISGGQRQRVALARTLVCEPRIVLLDEPLGALDANLRARMCDELKAIRERLGVSFLHVTGSETEALTMGDRVAVLSGGRIVQADAPERLFAEPANAQAARHLNAWNIFDAGLCAGGGAGQLGVRFDQIDISAPGQAPGAHLRLPARFLAGEFNGPTALSFFRAADGSLLQVTDHLSQPRLPDLVEGQDYDLHFAPQTARQFPGAAR